MPSPADLLRKAKAEQQAKEKKIQVAHLDLGTMSIGERPVSSFSLLGGPSMVTSLHEVLQRLDRVKNDKAVRAVLLTLGTGTTLNMAQAQELRRQLDEIRQAGKRVFVYADSYSTTDYMLASAATDVCILPAGEWFMPGVYIESMFLKGAMDKVGLVGDFVQIGEYKGADEMFTRTEPSEEARSEMTKLVNGLYNEIVTAVSSSRNVSKDVVKRAIDDAMIPAPRMKELGLVDHLVDMDGLRAMLAEELGDEINLLSNYGGPERPKIDFSNPLSILQAMNQRPDETEKDKIAIIYAQGVITDGSGGGGGLFGGEAGIGSDPMRSALRMALRDEKVRAVVVRIDSPGGSALASEAIWQSIRRVSAQKPVVISIGGMAASGGYYLASAGDHIIAEPAAIIGSIGVVGGKVVLGGLFEKIGIGTAGFAAGRNADLFSTTKAWDDRQRRIIRTMMKAIYDQFIDRIEATRKDKIDDIDEVARGRIFLARDAKESGMVDALGGLEDALAEAAKRAGLKEGTWDTRVLPPAPTLSDLLTGSGNTMSLPGHMTGQTDAALMLSLLPEHTRAGVIQFIQLSEILRKRPAALMTPYVITVR